MDNNTGVLGLAEKFKRQMHFLYDIQAETEKNVAVVLTKRQLEIFKHLNGHSVMHTYL